MSLFSSLLYLVITTVFILFIAVYIWFQYQYTYWKKRNLFYEKPRFPFGNFKGIATTHSCDEILKKLYDSHKEKKAFGIFVLDRPFLFVKDLNIAKNILIKDFNLFTDRGFSEFEKYEPLSGHLPFLNGNKWRNVRTGLSPGFTSMKMKMMFPIFVESGANLKNFLGKVAERNDIIEVKEFIVNYTMDLMALSAFGLKVHSFDNPNSEFKRLGTFLFNMTFFQALLSTFCLTYPKLAGLLHVRMIPKKIADFFMQVVKDIIEIRGRNTVERNDIMQLIIGLKNKGKFENADGKHKDIDYDPTFTFNNAAALAFGFFFGGFESSSRTLLIALYELASHQDIQEKLREEMDRVFSKHGQITYDGIQEMTYLDQVVSETLRKYPAVPNILRSCTEPCYIPEIDLELKRGSRVVFSVLGLHYDPDYYPDPQTFNPDRFSPENRGSIKSMSYLPFGAGPRSCIGMRFGLMLVKFGIFVVLSNFKVAVSEKTETPLKFNPKSFMLEVEGEIYLKLSNRS